MSEAYARTRGGTITTWRPTGARAATILLLLSALLLAACGGDDDTATTDTDGDNTTTSAAGGNDSVTVTKPTRPPVDDSTTSVPTSGGPDTTVAPSGGSGVEVYPTTFDRLNDIDMDADGTVWVTEANTSELVEISADGPVVHYTGEQESTDPESEMSGLAIAPDGQVWFATRKGIARLDPATDTAEYIVTAATSDLAGPIYQLAVSSEGEVFIGDVGPDKVFRLDGTELVHIAGAGTAPAGDDSLEGPAIDAALGDIRDIDVDDEGNLYIADDYGQRVRMVTPDGTMSTFAGGGDIDPVAETEAAPKGTEGTALDLESPSGVWVIGETVYVADPTYGLVFSIDPTDGYQVVLTADQVDASVERGTGLTSDDIHVMISSTNIGRIL